MCRLGVAVVTIFWAEIGLSNAGLITGLGGELGDHAAGQRFGVLGHLPKPVCGILAHGFL